MNTRKKTLNVFGASSCWGARDHDCAGGPQALYALGLLRQLEDNGYDCQIYHLAEPQTADSDPQKVAHIAEYCGELAEGVRRSIVAGEKFAVIGGDHSCAIGSWSGAAVALASRGDIGLIWIDAHMDSHTPFTSHSGAVHGMPLAVLFGRGDPRLTSIMSVEPKLKPQNVCLIGVRSFEEEEQTLLRKLGVRVYSQNEVRERGLAEVLSEARAIVRQQTAAYGISIDLDAIDPQDAPGVGSPEPNGLSGKALKSELQRFRHDDDLLGIEIVELNPVRDKFGQTSALALDLLLAAL
jgi:arginase